MAPKGPQNHQNTPKGKKPGETVIFFATLAKAELHMVVVMGFSSQFLNFCSSRRWYVRWMRAVTLGQFSIPWWWYSPDTLLAVKEKLQALVVPFYYYYFLHGKVVEVPFMTGADCSTVISTSSGGVPPAGDIRRIAASTLCLLLQLLLGLLSLSTEWLGFDF